MAAERPNRGVLVEIRGLNKTMKNAAGARPDAVGAIAAHMEMYLRIQRSEQVSTGTLETAPVNEKVDRMTGVMTEMAKDHKTRQFIRNELKKLSTELDAIDDMRRSI